MERNQNLNTVEKNYILCDILNIITHSENKIQLIDKFLENNTTEIKHLYNYFFNKLIKIKNSSIKSAI